MAMQINEPPFLLFIEIVQEELIKGDRFVMLFFTFRISSVYMHCNQGPSYVIGQNKGEVLYTRITKYSFLVHITCRSEESQLRVIRACFLAF